MAYMIETSAVGHLLSSDTTPQIQGLQPAAGLQSAAADCYFNAAFDSEWMRRVGSTSKNANQAFGLAMLQHLARLPSPGGRCCKRLDERRLPESMQQPFSTEYLYGKNLIL